MADPLFIPVKATLVARLRLTGAPDSGDIQTLIDEAMLVARTEFYRQLTAARVTTILATASTATPTTDAEVLRSIAEITEERLCRRYLLRKLPTLFVDGSAAAETVWNEAPIHGGGLSDTEREIRRLDAEIQENMELLIGEDSLRNESSVRGGAIGPDVKPPRPGDSLFGNPAGLTPRRPLG